MAYIGNRPLKGLHPVNNGIGNSAPRVREYAVQPSTDSIGEGCVVIYTSTGLVLGDSNDVAGTVVGVAAQNYVSTADAATILVYDDPNQEFAILVDGTVSAAVQISMVGQFATYLTNTYNTTLEQANTILDISTATGSAAATVLLQIMKPFEAVGDSLITAQTDHDGSTSIYGQVIVKFANSFHRWAL